MANRTCLAIVLAAGEGTRMRSSRPKVLHEVAGRSLLAHVLDAVREAGCTETAVVIGPDAEAVGSRSQARAAARRDCRADRAPRHRACGAGREAQRAGKKPDDILVIFGDTPLIRPQTLTRMRDALADGAAVAVLGFRPARSDRLWPTGAQKAPSSSPFARSSTRRQRNARSVYAMAG